MSREKLAVDHVEHTKYENELKEALGYGTAVYFYPIAEVLEKLGLGSEEFSPMYGDVAFLVSNHPLNEEQLLKEVKAYIPERNRGTHGRID